MSLKTQAKVLRVLQDGEVEPVGAGKPFQVDVRVIAATNKDLVAEVESGSLPRGPLLPAGGRGAAHTAAARAPGGHPAARGAPLRAVLRRSTTAAPRAGARPPWTSSAATPGPATSASSRTSSNAP